MTVLLIDDQSAMTDAIEDMLADLVHAQKISPPCKSFSANDFYKARDFLEKRLNGEAQPCDMIISDLLMANRGLEPSVRPACQDTVLNGWTFLYHYILKEDSRYYSVCRDTKIIIFSAYRDALLQHLARNGLMDYWKRFTFVEKGNMYNRTGGFEKLREKVEYLAEEMKG